MKEVWTCSCERAKGRINVTDPDCKIHGRGTGHFSTSGSRPPGQLPIGGSTDLSLSPAGAQAMTPKPSAPRLEVEIRVLTSDNPEPRWEKLSRSGEGLRWCVDGSPLSPERLEELAILADCLERDWEFNPYAEGWEIHDGNKWNRGATLQLAWEAAMKGEEG